MQTSGTEECPPLLKPGEHSLSLEEVRELCVAQFPASPQRRKLYDGFCKFLDFVRHNNIEGEIWIGGSFLTQKPDPGDIDLVLYVDHRKLDIYSTEQQWLIELLDDTDSMLHQFGCHVFVEIVYEEGHHFHNSCNIQRLCWEDCWGTASDDREKGYVVLTTGC